MTASIQEIAEQSIAFVRRSGLRVLECRPGFAQCRMPLAGNENHFGGMYAGAQFTLADITGGVLALASFDGARFYPTLKDLKLDFLKPAGSDLTLRYALTDDQLADLREQAERDGKARFVLAGDLLDADHICVARASGEFQVRRR